jgi:filamentous hemagglutinin
VRNDANEHGVGGVVASRAGVHIGAKAIENLRDSLIHAAHDIRTGRSLDANGRASDTRSDLFLNKGSVIDAGGRVDVAATRFENLNANFQTQKVTTDSGRKVWYTIPGSNQRFDSSDVYFYHGNQDVRPGTEYGWALDDDAKKLLLPSTKYPFAEYAKYTMNGVAGEIDILRSSSTDDEAAKARNGGYPVGVFRKVPDDTWATFGVAPSPPPPDPSYIENGKYAAVGPYGKVRELGPDWYSLNVPTAPHPHGWVRGEMESCVTAAAARCQPFKQWYESLLQSYTALAGAVFHYNNDVKSRAVDRWTIYDVKREIHERHRDGDAAGEDHRWAWHHD